MYLTRIKMPLHSRKTIEYLRNSQRMHQLVTRLFDSKQASGHILYRANVSSDNVMVYTYSDFPISVLDDEVQITGEKDITDLVESFEDGMVMNFDLLTYPYKKVKQADKKNSQRRGLKTYDERLNWLNRKARQNGFEILNVNESSNRHVYGVHLNEKGGSMHINAYEYQGVLRITDKELFKNAMHNGIGSGKAYGLGMMLVKQ